MLAAKQGKGSVTKMMRCESRNQTGRDCHEVIRDVTAEVSPQPITAALQRDRDRGRERDLARDTDASRAVTPRHAAPRRARSRHEVTEAGE